MRRPLIGQTCSLGQPVQFGQRGGVGLEGAVS